MFHGEIKMNVREKALEWVMQFETGRRWLDKVKMEKTGSKQTQEEYAYRLQKFCDWANKTPDQLVAERKQQLKPSSSDEDETKTEDLVTQFFNFLSGESKDPTDRAKKRTSAKSYYGAIRSFFRYNSTAKSPIALTGQTPKSPAGRRILPITLDEFKRIDAVVGVRDRALLRFMKDSGCSTEDVVVFNYGDIRTQFEKGEQFIHLKAVRQKTQNNYDTFIGPNAVEALKIYFDLRKQHGESFTDATPIFLTEASKKDEFGNPRPRVRLDKVSVRTIFARVKRQLVITVSPHRVRKLFSTQMASAHVHPAVIKYWEGHSMGSGDIEASYVIQRLDEQLKEYKNAYHCIDIQPRVDEREILIQNLMNSATAMGLSPEKLEEIRKVAKREKRMTPEDVAQMIRKELKTKTATDGGDCSDDKHCQKIVSEDELPQLLANGWMFVATLPSGKCVVNNET
jgi:site-specific recombinase XerC